MWTGAEVCVWTDLCMNERCSQTRIVKYQSLLKVFFIRSERVVSCADHYHGEVCMQLWQACICMRCAWISLDHCRYLCVAYSGWPKGIGAVTPAERRCVFFPWRLAGWLAVHLEKLSVNRPLTQKTGPLKNAHNWLRGGGLSMPPRSLEPPSRGAMTRTNCIHRPLHKNIRGPSASDGEELALW